MKESDVTWKSQSNVLFYKSICDLIKHSDSQIAQANQYYFTALGSMIPLLAVLIKYNFHWTVHLGIILLAASLGLQWLSLTIRLTLQKKCWCETARTLEEKLFNNNAAIAPFTYQKCCFSSPRKIGGSLIDSIMIKNIGSKYSRYATVLLLIFAMISISIYIFSSNGTA